MRPATRQLLFGHAVSPPPPPPASIGTPLVIGDNGAFGATSSTAATQVITLGAGISVAVGDLVVVAAANDNNNIVINGCSDPKNGSYSAGGAASQGGSFGSFSTLKHFFVVATQALVAGDQISVTFSGDTTGHKYVQIFKVPGGILGPTSAVLDASGRDASSTFTNTASAQPSLTTPALSQAKEIVFVTTLFDPYTSTLTSGSGFTDFANPPFHNFDIKIASAWEIVSSASAVSYTGTISDTTGNWMTAFTTFKGS